MLSDKLPDVVVQIGMGIMRLAKLTDDKLIFEKVSSLIQLEAKMRGYQKEFNNNSLILSICAKKIEFVHQAKSKTDLNEILALPKLYYNFNEVVPIGKFHVEEEELLLWCLTSMWCGGPLNEAGVKRYIKLFTQFYPDLAKEMGLTVT